jgi:hypothetical protein
MLRATPAATGHGPRGNGLTIDPEHKPAHSAAQLPFHPLADIFPLMEGEEFDALVADIKANALRFQIVLCEGKILDGRNRYRAMLAAGHTPTEGHFQEYEPAIPSDTPLSYVIRANLHRRHLTAEQRRDVIAKLIEAQPEKSDRQIAKQAKADHKTVGTVRRARESTGEISPVEKRVGADGKARKQPKPRDLKKERLERKVRMLQGRDGLPSSEEIMAAGDDDTKLEKIFEAQAIIDRLRESLRAAELKIVGLESEVEESKSGTAFTGNLVERCSPPRAAHD